MIGDIKKWSWGEMTSNDNGKTSITGTSGFICLMIGLLGFVFSLIASAYKGLNIEYVYASIIVISIGSGLLGYKKKIAKDIAMIKGKMETSEKKDDPQDTDTQNNEK